MIPTLRTLVLGLAASVAALAGVWLAAPPTRGEVRVPAPPEPPTGAPVERNAAVGMSGCLAAACHGAPAADALAGKLPDPMWPASGTCWVAADPHLGAYDALVRETTRRGSPNARDIVAKLGSGKAAAEDARCLACHTNPSLAGPTEDAHVLALRREGVSCEACHGNAGGWLRTHTAGDFSATAPLAEVGNRATTCLGCHVGAPADESRGYPARDMNHDMIAAGHPRLNFDFAEYHGRLPRHWRERHAPSPVREWFVGRVAHAESACRLLADRASRAERNDERTPWPEFAEFACASCHHKFDPEPRAPTARPPGSLRWQTIWPVAHGGETEPAPLREVTAAVRARRTVGPGTVAETARRAAAGLADFRASLAALRDDELITRVAPLVRWTAPPREDWDEVRQILNGVYRLDRLRPGKEPPDFLRARDAFLRRDWPATRDAVNALLIPEVGPAGRDNHDRE